MLDSSWWWSHHPPSSYYLYYYDDHKGDDHDDDLSDRHCYYSAAYLITCAWELLLPAHSTVLTDHALHTIKFSIKKNILIAGSPTTTWLCCLNWERISCHELVALFNLSFALFPLFSFCASVLHAFVAFVSVVCMQLEQYTIVMF